MAELSIIIVNYNTKELLRDCITSIRDTGKNVPFEIIIVDNASHDGSQAMLKEQFPECNLIENDRNLGFGKANNQGMKRGMGRFILLLNSDTVVKNDALGKMLAFMEEHREVGMLGPRLLNADGSTQPSVSIYPNVWYVLLRMLRLRKIFPVKYFKGLAVKYNIFGSTVRSYFEAESVQPVEVDFVSGACMLLRRSVLDRAGMFDENFFMYLEDFDLCKRIKTLGWGIWYYPLAEIVHLGGQSADGFREVSPLSYESLYYYFNKHHGRLKELLVRGIVMLSMAARVCIKVIAHPIDTLVGRNKIVKDYIAIMKNAAS